MTVDRGLEVVIPRGFSRRKVPALVEGKRDWIARAAARAEARRRRLEADPPHLPERIVLPALGEEWAVEYRPGPIGSAHVAKKGAAGGVRAPIAAVRERPERHLVVTLDPDDFAACRDALCRWLGRRARRALPPRLAVLAYEHHLAYARTTVRQQRTRWGSCSRHKTISLNARLLFVPPDVVDYVLVHELCHTVEMSHSARFWALVEAHDPDYREHKKLLRESGKTLPSWLDRGPAQPVE